MLSSAISIIGVVLTAIGTGVTLWQASQVRKYRDQIAHDVRRIRLAEIVETLRLAQAETRKIITPLTQARRGTVNTAFPDRNDKVDVLLRDLGSQFLSRSGKPYVVVEGPARMLDAIANKINDFRRRTSLYYAGAIHSVSTSSGGMGSGPFATHMIAIHFREGVSRSDAMQIAKMVIDRIAKEEGIVDVVDEVSVSGSG